MTTQQPSHVDMLVRYGLATGNADMVDRLISRDDDVGRQGRETLTEVLTTPGRFRDIIGAERCDDLVASMNQAHRDIASASPAPVPAPPVGATNYPATSARDAASSTTAQPPTPRPLINEKGVVHDYVPGVGYQPRTHFGGIEVRDTTVGGAPAHAPSIGSPQPARILGGPSITGPGGKLYPRRPAGGSPFA